MMNLDGADPKLIGAIPGINPAVCRQDGSKPLLPIRRML